MVTTTMTMTMVMTIMTMVAVVAMTRLFCCVPAVHWCVLVRLLSRRCLFLRLVQSLVVLRESRAATQAVRCDVPPCLSGPRASLQARNFTSLARLLLLPCPHLLARLLSPLLRFWRL